MLWLIAYYSSRSICVTVIEPRAAILAGGFWQPEGWAIRSSLTKLC
jgi:hypothetical protein